MPARTGAVPGSRIMLLSGENQVHHPTTPDVRSLPLAVVEDAVAVAAATCGCRRTRSRAPAWRASGLGLPAAARQPLRLSHLCALRGSGSEEALLPPRP